MITPVLCGSQQSYIFNKKVSHGLLNPVQKSVDKSQGSNQSSNTKEKRSLKYVTNKQTKPMIASQFKKQAKLTDTNQKVKDQTKNQKISHVLESEKEKAKVPINSYFLLNQNRRKFQSLSNRPLLNTSQNKNNRSQHSYFLNKTLVPNSKPIQKPQIQQKPENILLVKKQLRDFQQKKCNQEKSQILKTQKQKNSRVSFLSKPNFPFDQNNKYSLKPHFSVGNFKSSSHQYLKNSKSIESLNNSQQRRSFLRRSTLKFEENTKNSSFYSIKTQRQNSPQIEERSNFFPLKKGDLNSKQRRQRISTQGNEKVIQKKDQLKNKNNVSMSRFFSLKTSRFFIPKRQQHQKTSNQKNQKIFECSNLDLQIINQDSQINIKNELKCQDLIDQYGQNIYHQMQLENKSNLTDSTKVSTFFDINNWKKRQIQNRFTSENDPFRQFRFGFHTQSNPKKDQKQKNFVNSKSKSRVSQDNFVFIQNQLENSQQKLSNDKKIQIIVTNLKRNTIIHQPLIQNFTLTRNFSMQGSLIHNNIKKQNTQNQTQNQTNRINRNSNKRPSFFADLQRNKQQRKEFRKEQEKVILQRDEQQNLESNQLGMFSNIEIKDAESVVDSEFNNSQKGSQIQFVLHSTDKIQLKSFAHLNMLQSDRKNFLKFK